MTGAEVTDLRTHLRMTYGQFAQLIGVNQSTLYRWEVAGEAQVHIDPLHNQLLTVLQQQVNLRRGEAERRKFAEALLQGLLIGGGMLALFKLLEAAFGGSDQRRTSGAGARSMVARARNPAPRRRKP